MPGRVFSFERNIILKVWKIFDTRIDKNGIEQPCTLFHGLHGSRMLKVGKWMKAEKRMVTDGSRTIAFESGFHGFKTQKEVRAWLHRATKLAGRVVVETIFRDCRAKPRSVGNTILGDSCCISRNAWKRRTTARDFISN